MRENYQDRITRYNQEQQRAALEKQQDEARQVIEQEKRAIEGLSEIWQELDVEAALRKIREEVWNHKGELRVSNTPTLVPPQSYAEEVKRRPPIYIVSASLEFTWEEPAEAKPKPILEQKFGFHKEPVYIQSGWDNVPEDIQVGERTVLGRYEVEVGRKGTYELETRSDILSVELRGGFSTYERTLFGYLKIHAYSHSIPHNEVQIKEYLERIQVLKEILDSAFFEDCVERTRRGYLPDVYIKKAKEGEDRLRLRGYSRV